MSNYVSLFEYLGKAAGSDLGKQVAEYAKKRDIKIQTRNVKTKSYTGKVMLYPQEFLMEYFSMTTLEREVSVK